MAKPHDSPFRDTFSRPEHARALLRALVPEPLRSAIDWKSLRLAPGYLVDEKQDTQHTDPLFVVRAFGRKALLYLDTEHKARPDRWTALQVHAYVVGVWREESKRSPRPKHLPPILPIVISFGRRRWRVTTDLHSLIDFSGLSAGQRAVLEAASPQFRIAPHDFAARTAAEVRAMGLTPLGLWTVAAQQFIASVGHDDAAAARAIAEWADVARRVLARTGQRAIDAVSSYLLKVTKLGKRRLRALFDQHIGARSMKKFVSTYERITRESKAEGKAEGELTGAARTLLRLLRRRFGAIPKSAAAHIASGSVVDIDRWTDRVLDAATLADVFADD